jgi:DNA replication and repair protein RecF
MAPWSGAAGGGFGRAIGSPWDRGSTALWLAELRLRDFRNYTALDVSLEPGVTVLEGPNAQGKSNLLESIYTVAMGRSPRAGSDAEVIRFGQDRAYVRAAVRNARAHVLEVALDRRTGEKRIKVNGVPAQRGQLLGRMAVVLAGPLDDEVIRGAPAYRRRVLDAALAQASPSYYFVLMRYLRVVRQRNRLLREAAAGPYLAPWDEQLAELGAVLVERRRRFVAALAGKTRARHARISGGGEEMGVAYVCSAGEGEERAAISRAIAARRREELRRGVSLVGPHRDDLRLTINGIDLRAFGSRGQQHTAALSLRLAEAEMLHDELGEWPVVLLDDVLADLDAARQAFLVRELAGPQVLLTHTGSPATGAVPVRLLSVRSGTVVEGQRVRP